MTLVRGWSELESDAPPAIAVLGPLQVRRPDGSTLAIPARKHTELLVLLASERTTRSAGYLCELLWRGNPPESALVTLQGYVSRLRRSLSEVPDVRIETAANGYVLRCDGANTDLDLLDALSRDARTAMADGDVERCVELLDRALALWRGEVLTEIADIAEIAPERARLDELRSELTEMCAEGLIALGRARHAVTLLTDARERHPLREGVTRLLALALRDSGRTSEALDVLVGLRRALRDELGLDPTPETVRVENEIRNPAEPQPLPISAQVPPESGLVGRADIAAQIDRAWQRSEHELTIITVRGPAGVGKTAVVFDALRRHHAGALFGGGISGGQSQPLEAVAPWLDQAALDGRTVPAAPTPRDLAALLAEIGRETGHVVAIIDDLQWADLDSVRLVAAAIRVLRAHPVLLMLTVRPEPLAPELDSLVSALRGAGNHVAIELSGLPDASIAALIAAELGDVAGVVREDLVAQSHGSPFLARQLCDLVRAGLSVTEGGTAAVTEAKLASVSAAAGSLAEIVAVIGPQASIVLAAAVDDSPGFDLRLRELVSVQVVSVIDAEIAFSHDLVRRAILDRIGAVRIADLHRRIADALGELTPDAVAALALHRSAAAMDAIDSTAARSCAAAARDSLRRGAFGDCAELAERGLRHAGNDDSPLLIELDSLAGQALNRMGDYESAAAHFDRSGERYVETGDWSGLAHTALLAAPRGVGGYFSGFGVIQRGSSALRTQALAHRLDLDPDLIAEILAIEATDRAVHGTAGDLDNLADALARSAPGARSWPQVRLAEFVCNWQPATLADREKIADELAELAGPDPQARATALHLRRVCALEAGDLRLVRRLSAEFARLVADGGTDIEAMQLWWRVMYSVLRGEYEQSNALMNRLADGLGAVSAAARQLAEVSLLTSRSIELWHRGRLGESLEAVDQMAEDFDEDFALVVAMGAAEVGDYERALRLVETIIALPGRLHGPRLAVRVPLLVEALLAVGQQAPEHRNTVREFAAALEPHTEGWGDALVVQRPGLVCLGPSGLYRGTVRGILGREGARAEVESARRRARALGARPYEARAEQRLGGWPFAADAK